MFWKPKKSEIFPGGKNVSSLNPPVRKASPSNAMVFNCARSDVACVMVYLPGPR
jgi:hypothetical protein